MPTWPSDTKCQGCGKPAGVLITDDVGTFCNRCRAPKSDVPGVIDVPSSPVLDAGLDARIAAAAVARADALLEWRPCCSVCHVEAITTHHCTMCGAQWEGGKVDASQLRTLDCGCKFVTSAPDAPTVQNAIEQHQAACPGVFPISHPTLRRLREATAAFYAGDVAEPPPDELEARERDLDAALRGWAQSGMPS